MNFKSCLLTMSCLLFAVSASAQLHRKSELRIGYQHVGVEIHGDVAKTTVTQVLVNGLNHSVEAVFRYPLPSDATVTQFGEWREGRLVSAIVQGEKEAQKTYDRAVERGERSVLAKIPSENQFEMSLFDVPAKSMRRVQLEYVQTVTGLGGERTFVLPRDRAHQSSVGSSDFSVQLHEDKMIRKVTTKNQPDAHIKTDGGRSHVRFNRTGAPIARDIVVRWQRSLEPLDLDAKVARVESDEGGFLVTRLAFDRDPIPEAEVERDIIILIDSSLSMAGEPLDRARHIANSVLNSARARDRIQVMAFSDTVRSPTSGLRLVNGAQKAATVRFLEELRAEGRSDLNSALHEAAKRLEKSEDGVVLLLTDGQPTFRHDGQDPFSFDTDLARFSRIRVVAAQFNYPHRHSALKAMLPNLTLRFIPDGDGGKTAMEQVVALTTSTTLTDLSIEFEGTQPEQVHGSIPDRLAVGESVRLVARLDGPTTIRVTGFLHGEPIEVSREISIPQLSPDDSGRNLAIEWARVRVAELEGRLSHKNTKEQRRYIKEEIKYLGERFALATSQTSFVLTDSLAPDRIKPGDPEIRIHAPRSSLGVFGILPWGERVNCSWDEEEELWLGRFLVPRHTSDGLYRVRIFVEQQARTVYRGALFFRVDSQLPEFELITEGSTKPKANTSIHVIARPKRLSAGKGLDEILPDPIDIKTARIKLDGRIIELIQSEDGRTFAGEVPLGSTTGRRTIELLVLDYARNFRKSFLTIEVTK